MKKVDVIIVSTGRAASTVIYQYINSLTDLGLPRNKEPHFWCDVTRYGGIYPLLRSLVVAEEEGYWGLYCESKYVVDASVGYIFCLNEVIHNLHFARLQPKILFLYREPVSRAISLFNELKKKNLTQVACIEDDIKKPVESGLWWEYYYDNVDYYDNFVALTASFEEVLAVNYEFFSKNQRYVLQEIFRFLRQDPSRLERAQLEPVNSSKEAIMQRKLAKYRRFSAFVPRSLKRQLKRVLVAGGALLLRPHRSIYGPTSATV